VTTVSAHRCAGNRYGSRVQAYSLLDGRSMRHVATTITAASMATARTMKVMKPPVDMQMPSWGEEMLMGLRREAGSARCCRLRGSALT